MFWRHNIIGVLWALFILAICGLPHSQVPKTNLFQFDKVVHFGIYALFVVILVVGFKKQAQYRWLRYKAIPIAIVFAACYGVLIEVLQGTVFSGRSMEFFDVVANTAGAGFGFVCFYLIYGRSAV